MNEFLETAAAIARRICRDAIWWDGACNWIGPSIEGMNAWDIRQKSFGPELYAGTSGVAVFLAAAARATGERLARKAAEGAARHALRHAAEIPPPAGLSLYSGTLGIAWALLRVGEALDDAAWSDRAIALVDGVVAEDGDAGLDVMSGYAGAVPALLGLARECGRPEWTEGALRCGERLTGAAERSDEGWSWKTLAMPEPMTSRNLTGFSHGTAGIGWALLELWSETGEHRFRAAAEAAFRYERAHYSPEHENWRDFRDYLRPPGAGAEPAYATAWCHGAPGIALSRMRAWELTADPRSRDEAEAAIRTTLRTVESRQAVEAGFSLCHGCAGNADVLLEAARALPAPGARGAAEAIAHAGIEQIESRRLPWPCGVPGGGESASLMLGTAGIGLFYLRLAAADAPGVLRIGPSSANSATTRAAGQASAD